MKREINDFVDEITTNFSELYVETFLLRFLREFDKNELLECIQKANKILNKKIKNKISKSFKSMGN